LEYNREASTDDASRLLIACGSAVIEIESRRPSSSVENEQIYIHDTGLKTDNHRSYNPQPSGLLNLAQALRDFLRIVIMDERDLVIGKNKSRAANQGPVVVRGNAALNAAKRSGNVVTTKKEHVGVSTASQRTWKKGVVE
jgi:hypothetical protein